MKYLFLSLLLLTPGSNAGPAACDCISLPASSATPLQDAGALRVRDFALYSHRRLAEDLIRGDGPWLATVQALFDSCDDAQRIHLHVQQLLQASSETDLFADRLARSWLNVQRCASSEVQP